MTQASQQQTRGDSAAELDRSSILSVNIFSFAFLYFFLKLSGYGEHGVVGSLFALTWYFCGAILGASSAARFRISRAELQSWRRRQFVTILHGLRGNITI